jgi:hypothetical protein
VESSWWNHQNCIRAVSYGCSWWRERRKSRGPIDPGTRDRDENDDVERLPLLRWRRLVPRQTKSGRCSQHQEAPASFPPSFPPPTSTSYLARRRHFRRSPQSGPRVVNPGSYFAPVTKSSRRSQHRANNPCLVAWSLVPVVSPVAPRTPPAPQELPCWWLVVAPAASS